jgi:hypothetical protein
MTQPTDLEAAFWSFHSRHPDVYLQLRDLCDEWRSHGRARWSIKGAFEVLRWQRHTDGLRDEHEAFLLNNSYTSRYARLLIELNPDLDGLFELRELHATRAA